VNRLSRLEPVFVDGMPRELEAGKFYISNEYHVTKHLCACGCAEVVTLPLHPEQWRYTYDGKSISVHPSVGNVGTTCNSHYWIVTGNVEWAKTITPAQAHHGWKRDRADLETFDAATSHSAPAAVTPVREPFWRRLLRF